MKILVIGQGGREHALAWKLSQSPQVREVFVAPGNAGTAEDVTNVRIASDDIPRLQQFARDQKIDLTVVGPEAPLVNGIVDEFQKDNLRVFGPSRAAARLEGSKVFCKEILRKGNIPTARWFSTKLLAEALEYLEAQDEGPIVVKADGLAAGKGVFVCGSLEEARQAAARVLKDREFGDAGGQLLIEDCLEGQEASILALVDGDTIIPLETSQDHKRALDGDHGPNTGGMGAYSPAPVVTPKLMDEIVRRILVPTVHTMKMEGCPFRGILYAGLMLTKQGPYVLEYNVRFGDPEAQPILMRLQSDLAQVLSLAAEGRLHECDGLDWDPRPSLCVVMASRGYPGGYEKGHDISGLASVRDRNDVKVFHAGTALRDDAVVNSGGRVLGVTAIGDDLAAARAAAYNACESISWNGSWYRSDISMKSSATIS